MRWTRCTVRLQKPMLGYWVTAVAAARRWRLFFLDSYPHYVTKGQLVFSASSTAAPPGCRCDCNPAGRATPVLIKTGEGTRRIAVVQSGVLFSWRQPDFFFFFSFWPDFFPFFLLRVISYACVATLLRGNTGQLWSAASFFTAGSQSENKVSAHCQPALHWCMTVHFPCTRYRELFQPHYLWQQLRGV